MINLYDVAYALAVVASAPIWAARQRSRHKVLRAFGERMGYVAATPDGLRPVVLIHAVSLGEMNATRAMVARLRELRPGVHVVVSTTTDAGYDRGRELYPFAGQVKLVRYPLDFSTAIDRFLARLRPDVVVLMELELWPNFLLHCRRRSIPAVLVNGRITPTAFARYRWLGPVVARMFRRLSAVCAQDESYARRFIELGAPVDRVGVSGTMKFDTAELADRVAGDDALAAEIGIDPLAGPLWVCGSTGPGEDMLLLGVYRRLLERFPTLRLAIVPRKPERFDEVADQIRAEGLGLRRRSGKPGSIAGSPVVVLGDTLGELRKFYSLADLVFVGRSLVDLGARQHGSDMIEPAALAKPVAVGPFTHNFAEPMRLLLAGDGVSTVESADALAALLSRWLVDPNSAADQGLRAQQVVRENQGATARHVETILHALGAQK